MAAVRLDHAVNQYRKHVEEKNHGLKCANICRLFLPLGIDESKIDSALIASLDAFREDRGLIAHTSVIGVSKMLDPGNESNRVHLIISQIALLDEYLRYVCQK